MCTIFEIIFIACNFCSVIFALFLKNVYSIVNLVPGSPDR